MNCNIFRILFCTLLSVTSGAFAHILQSGEANRDAGKLRLYLFIPRKCQPHTATESARPVAAAARPRRCRLSAGSTRLWEMPTGPVSAGPYCYS
ncbi:hypothetical protein BL250_09370 [Erwinia sp. OLTSP20]|nr:hypothetical protein BV501_07050 [Erwinia sp. OAMSP11]PIJ75404.1 hypothetical protein BK416_01845 [Erwinia sp. OLSSP12]PIJ81902.1 hypothetical protein BLD47_07395 [Erwinia sp. OLCASP19]PIJ84557.1 hypothetical protein BLD46_07485 [Erwinia sp. OLMTSP26]PIJ86904.1 hypothetical protein BLD49_07255 [Erwinia sp. OLMDSP33]PIJ90999.1 hypothetical protein BL249_10365 [Erwinia sp. OLFS4]PIJ92488.1 hypothetical protein BL250_09370 [Erwinia sp. OLTSP20]